ncbi:fumarate hydratase [Roseibium sp. TrichSKD4]|nr:fumarate hydratase [Roseibium sp. TrichSKD4]EFO31269.1 fumarate hydratase [Roseibium sp. TrichSKD4]
MSRIIAAEDIVEGVCDALQYVSYFHPPDFIDALYDAWQKEESV